MRLFTLIFCLATASIIAQSKTPKPVQISGVVITADSIPRYIPFANVVIKKRQRGTTSNAEGFFSLPALPGDTITVSVVGFKAEELAIPDSLEDKGYLARVVMQRDTLLLAPVTLYPWPTPENFKDAFLATQVPTKKEDIAMRNLAIQELKARAAEMGFSAAEVQDFAISMQNQNIYNYGADQIFTNGGTAILGRLSDPFAWARFFKSLKKDD
jgi:hypothetical protein